MLMDLEENFQQESFLQAILAYPFFETLHSPCVSLQYATPRVGVADA